MPHRRHVKKGSFGGHFDELVTQFPNDEASRQDAAERRKPPKDDGDVHDKLFENAWHKARRAQSSSFSNQ
jgi:hypothetical protein